MSELFSTLLAFGGPVVLILVVLSIIALAVTLQKTLLFWLNRVGRHRRAQIAVERWITGGKQPALASLDSDPSPVSIVLAHAMRGVLSGASEERVKEDVGRVAVESLHRLRAQMRTLETIAQIAPLLGLFGTVLGMIDTFSSLQEAGATVDPSELAGGIWVALLTTAVGLGVAMPVTVVASWFEGRIENERVSMESVLSGFFAARVTDPGAQGEAASGSDTTRIAVGPANAH